MSVYTGDPAKSVWAYLGEPSCCFGKCASSAKVTLCRFNDCFASVYFGEASSCCCSEYLGDPKFCATVGVSGDRTTCRLTGGTTGLFSIGLGSWRKLLFSLTLLASCTSGITSSGL